MDSVFDGTSEKSSITAILPEITGSCAVTGFANIVLDDRDPFKDGFLV